MCACNYTITIGVKQEEILRGLLDRDWPLLNPGTEAIAFAGFRVQGGFGTLLQAPDKRSIVFDAGFVVKLDLFSGAAGPFKSGFGLSGDVHTSQTWSGETKLDCPYAMGTNAFSALVFD